jgi:hypothetical protein
MGFLKAYEILRGNLLVAMDGTNYYSEVAPQNWTVV